MTRAKKKNATNHVELSTTAIGKPTARLVVCSTWNATTQSVTSGSESYIMRLALPENNAKFTTTDLQSQNMV